MKRLDLKIFLCVLSFASCAPKAELEVLETSPISVTIAVHYRGMKTDMTAEVALIGMDSPFSGARRWSFYAPSSSGTDTLVLHGLMPDTRHYCVPLISRNDKEYQGPRIEFITPAMSDKPVDLGLSIRWSSKNLGAKTVYSSGEFYKWGELTPIPGYFREYQYERQHSRGYNQKMRLFNLPASNDVAVQNMEKGWRMPTADEFQELIDKCTWEYMDCTRAYWLVTGPNGNQLIFPLRGYKDQYGHIQNDSHVTRLVGEYWSSSLYEEEENTYIGKLYNYTKASTLYLPSEPSYWGTMNPRLSCSSRECGLNIRPVYDDK